MCDTQKVLNEMRRLRERNMEIYRRMGKLGGNE